MTDNEAQQIIDSAAGEATYGTHRTHRTPQDNSPNAKIVFAQQNFIFGLEATCSGKEIYEQNLTQLDAALAHFGYGPARR